MSAAGDDDFESSSSWVSVDKKEMALLAAAENGHETVVQLLVEDGVNLEATGEKSSRTPLSCAATRGHEQIVQFLIKNGADIYGNG